MITYVPQGTYDVKPPLRFTVSDPETPLRLEFRIMVDGTEFIVYAALGACCAIPIEPPKETDGQT